VVNLAAGPGAGPETVFTYRDLATAPTFDGGVMNGSTTLDESTISDASGPFTVTWPATRIDITDELPDESADATAWIFGAETANIHSGGPGWVWNPPAKRVASGS
jgi:hypothetical protein